jgi:hypothetical protein
MSERPNLLLTGTAIAYFGVSLAFLFAGEELLRSAGAAATPVERALLQLLGAALFALAMLDWLNRYSLLGGIYGRPLVVANLSHAAIGALMLVHLVRELGASAPLLAALAFYGVLALLFGATLLRSPRAAGAPGGPPA